MEKENAVKQPVTKESLMSELRKLGVGSDQLLEVHASLSSFDYVVGGAATIVDALMELVGDGGTILMPTHVNGNSEPSKWTEPPVSPSLYTAVRGAIPAYNTKNSDIYGMGSVAENFRHRSGVVISSHPAVSYAAWGRYAKLLCNRQSLHFPLAEESPCARLYELKGLALLIGTDFDTCTCMHLAEYRNDCRPISIEGASLDTDEGVKWKKYLDLKLKGEDFLKVREVMKENNMIRETDLGGSHIQLFPAATAIDEATKYFEKSIVYDLYR